MPTLEPKTKPNRTPTKIRRGPRYYLSLLAAGVCFLVGVLGAVLPVLPATPFLLLTSYFLVRTSPRMNEALLKTRWIGPILRDWQTRGGVSPPVKARAIVMVVGIVVATIALSDLSPGWAVVVALLALIGIAVIVRLPSPRDEHLDQ